MRENRLYGSEGGGTELNRFSLPLSGLFLRREIVPDANRLADLADRFFINGPRKS